MSDTFIKFKYEIRSKINNFKVGYYYCAVSVKAVIGCWYVLGIMYCAVSVKAVFGTTDLVLLYVWWVLSFCTNE